MIDHIGIEVAAYEAAREFYKKALAPLGYEMVAEHELPQGTFCGFGAGGKPEFWISKGEPARPIHVAFKAQDRAAVDAFYEAATAAGAKDNGAPGVREIYHPNYYGAFVLDADGNNIEAVCHAPPSE